MAQVGKYPSSGETMRTILLIVAVMGLSCAIVASQTQVPTTGTGRLSARIDRMQRTLDSVAVRQSPATQTALDSMRHELSLVKVAVTELARELASARAVDSMIQLLCSEIDLLKLDNQMLMARLDAGQSAYASTENGEFVTSGTPIETKPALEQTPVVETEPSLTFSGYVDAAGSFDNNSHKTDLNLNQLQLDIEKSVSDRASFRADVEVVSDGFDGYQMELEQGFVRVAPISSKAWQLSFGRFNSPIGVERFDPDQTYLYTRGFLFDNALPTNLTGLMSNIRLSQHFDLTLMAVNGWNINADNNTGKSFGSRFGITPCSGLKVGFSVLSGPELDDEASMRTIYDIDVTLTHAESWNLALELHQGQETQNPEIGSTAKWNGVMLVGHTALGERFCATARADYFNDRHGSRTGVSQELKSLAISPAMSIVDGLDMILELRQDWSNRAGLGADDSAASSTFSSALEFTYSF